MKPVKLTIHSILRTPGLHVFGQKWERLPTQSMAGRRQFNLFLWLRGILLKAPPRVSGVSTPAPGGDRPVARLARGLQCTLGGGVRTPNASLRLSAIISANAADVAAVENGGWAVISPYGQFPSPDKTYTQIFDRAQAEKTVKTWNSVAGTAARLFKNLVHGLGATNSAPIWDGHPETDKQRWPKERLLATVDDIRAGATGLEGKISWNAKGMEKRTAGPLYPSPLWWHMPPAGNPPAVYPELLESIGLVPTPNISNVPAWTNNSSFETQYAAGPGEQDHLPTDDAGKGGADPLAEKPQIDVASAEAMKGTTSQAAETAASTTGKSMKKITTHLGLPDTATEDDIIAKLLERAGAAQTANAAQETLRTQLTTANASVVTLTGERDTLRTANAALTTERDSFKTANAALIDGIVIVAEKTGKITPAQREELKGKITANAAQALKELSEARTVLNTANVEINGKRMDLSTANARQTVFNGEVQKRMKAGNIGYDAAFEEVLKDPQFKPLADAMGVK